jgi:hypothetical protein
MLVTGKKSDGSGTDETEIINVETSATVSCPSANYFPTKVFSSEGILLRKSIPFVCSGYNDNTNCFSLKNNVWELAGRLNHARYKAVMMPKSPFQHPDHEAIIIGGFGGIRTMEVFNGTTWSLTEPALPINIGGACAVYANPSTVFLIAGVHGSPYSQNTYYLNGNEKQWVPGPKLNNGRYNHVCGRLIRSQNSAQLSTIVAGGYSTTIIDSVEILDDGSSTWRLGPNLPVATYGASVFEDPRGGVIVIGGATPSGNSGSMYRLRHAGLDAKWETLVQQAMRKLYNSVAIPIPDELSLC